MPKKITIRGHIGYDVRAADVQKQLEAAGGKPVSIELSGPGGLVSAGLEIFNLIRDYPGRTEVVYMGYVASMDSYIGLAADKRITHDNAVFMIHHVISGGMGNYHALQKIVNHAKSLSTLLAQEYIAKTGLSPDKMDKLMEEETYYYGQEIVDAGFADVMIEAPDDGKSKASLNKETAVAETRMGVEAVFARMREDEAGNSDLERAAAYIDLHNPEANQADLFTQSIGMVSMESDMLNIMGMDFDPKAEYKDGYQGIMKDASDFKAETLKSMGATLPDGKAVTVIMGRMGSTEAIAIQSVRYSEAEWSEADAKAHCKENKGIRFDSIESGRVNNKPASAGKTTEGGNIMPTLLDLLALPENAGAKAEHGAMIDKAATLGKKEGEKAFQEIASKVMPVLGSVHYPKPMKELAGKVLKGETPISAFDAGVASFDSTAEGVKIKEAIAEQAKQEETPPGQGAPASGSEDGTISNEDDFQAAIARMKGEPEGKKGDE